MIFSSLGGPAIMKYTYSRTDGYYYYLLFFTWDYDNNLFQVFYSVLKKGLDIFNGLIVCEIPITEANRVKYVDHFVIIFLSSQIFSKCRMNSICCSRRFITITQVSKIYISENFEIKCFLNKVKYQFKNLSEYGKKLREAFQ